MTEAPIVESPWLKHSSRVIHETQFMVVREDAVTTPAGNQGTYTYLTMPAFVLIILHDALDRVLLVRQYRYPSGRFFLEFPAGGIEDGETVEQASDREAGEECGYAAATYTNIGLIQEAISNSDHPGTVMLGRNLRETPDRLIDDEGITENHWLWPAEINTLIRDGAISDAKTLAAWAMFTAYQS